MPTTNDISAIITTGKAGSGKDYVLHSLVKDLETEVPGINIKIDKFANTMKHMINEAMLSTVGESVDGKLTLSEPLINQAIPHYLRLADNNNPLASYNLGLLYENGAGVPCDIETALVFYSSAAEHSKDADMSMHAECLTKISSIKAKLISSPPPATTSSYATSLSEEAFEALKNDGNLKFNVGKAEDGSDISKSIREILQILGTDIIRNVSKNFHIAMLARKMIESDADVFGLGDVRFDNELLFVSALNSFSTPDEKYNFLNSIAHLDESTLPSSSELEEKLKSLLGTGALLEVMHEALMGHFYDPKYTKTSSESIDDMSYLLEGEYEFDNPPPNPSFEHKQDPYQPCFVSNAQVGIIPISRGNVADRGMDTSHNSELKALEIDKIVSSTPFPDGFVFMNNAGSLTENKQYFILKELIKESIVCPLNEKCTDSSRQP